MVASPVVDDRGSVVARLMYDRSHDACTMAWGYKGTRLLKIQKKSVRINRTIGRRSSPLIVRSVATIDRTVGRNNLLYIGRLSL